MTAEGSEFLKKRFSLHAAPETDKAAKRTSMRTGEKVPQRPAERIQNYLDRFKEVVERKDPEKQETGLRALKKVLDDAYVIKAEDIPESYFLLQQQIAREQGLGTVETTDKKRKEAVKVIQADQRVSLNKWIDYLAGGDALYPDWAKYWAFRSLLGMSLYDKEKKQFGNRSKHTTARFPDLNREALAYVVDVVVKQLKGTEVKNPLEYGENDYADEGKLVSDEDFAHMLSTENFAKYYAFAIEHVVSNNAEQLKVTDGEWKLFKKGSDASLLSESLQGYGTGWCTAGESTAEEQLKKGDFYVYYSQNAHGVPAVPRLAIRMDGREISEVRGVAYEQEIDAYIAPILIEKMQEFGERGKEYSRKAEEMKWLTQIDNKVKAGEELTRDDLAFLYEVEGEIEGFGESKDPRIDEIIKKRDTLADARIALDTHSDDEFVCKFLDSEEALQSKFLRVPLADDDEVDYDKFDEAQREFFEKELPKMRGLSGDAAEALLGHYLISPVVESQESFVFKDKFTILKLLMKYDEENGSEYAFEMLLKFFKGVSQTERAEFIEGQIDEGKFDELDKLLPQVENIPLRVAHKLVEADRPDVLASALGNFEPGLDNATAEKLINAGYELKVAENLKLFKGLSREVWDALEADALFSDLEKNKKSFDFERLRKNPFGQWVRENPFD